MLKLCADRWHRWGNLESLTTQRDTKLLNVSIVKVSSEPTMWSGDASFNKRQNFCLLPFHFIWCNNCNKTRSLPWSPLHVHTDSHSAPYQSVWIHSELSEEVHRILWRFNHISRLCLGATNFQSRHRLLSSTYSHSSFLLIKMLMSPRSPFQKCWIPFSQFRNTLLLIPTEYDLLTFNQTKYRHLFPMKTRAEQFETEAFFGFRSTMTWARSLQFPQKGLCLPPR